MSHTLSGSRIAQVGTFIKTTSPQVVEVLAGTGLDFAVLDAEHAPWHIGALDLGMLAGRAAGLPLFVRVQERSAVAILQALDIGAAGVLVPHVDSAADAADAVACARYEKGVRGYSPSARHGAYGSMAMKDVIDAGDATAVMCQIESAQAVEQIREIAAVEGLTGLFIGRGDLALSMGIRNPRDPAIERATASIIEAGVAAGKTVGMFVQDRAERLRFQELGVTWFVQASDQALLRRAARAMFADD